MSKQRQDEYLAKAREALDEAGRTTDRHEKESLVRIAREYRDLAEALRRIIKN
jgi:hypothetical protein